VSESNSFAIDKNRTVKFAWLPIPFFPWTQPFSKPRIYPDTYRVHTQLIPPFPSFLNPSYFLFDKPLFKKNKQLQNETLNFMRHCLYNFAAPQVLLVRANMSQITQSRNSKHLFLFVSSSKRKVLISRRERYI